MRVLLEEKMTKLHRVIFITLVPWVLGISACSDSNMPESDAAVSDAAVSDAAVAEEAPSLLPSGTIDRLAERSAPRFADGTSAPSLIVDPSWPKPLPNNWRIGQVGGIAVDSHDNIWVYHRPRSLSRSAVSYTHLRAHET